MYKRQVTKYPDYMTALAKSNEIIPMLDELFATKTVQEWSDILTCLLYTSRCV